MRRYLWVSVMAVLFIGTFVCAQERRGGDREPPHEMRFRNQQREIEADKRRAELAFDNQMREIQLAKERMKLEHAERNTKRPGFFHGRPPCGPGPGKKGPCELAPLFLLICAIMHILLSIWVYQDIRKRNSDEGIWIIITLISGFFGALLYAIVRLGDIKQK